MIVKMVSVVKLWLECFSEAESVKLSILNYCVTQSHMNSYYQHLFTNICLAAVCCYSFVSQVIGCTMMMTEF